MPSRGFHPIYAREVSEDLADGWMNGDEIPAWYWVVHAHEDEQAVLRPDVQKIMRRE